MENSLKIVGLQLDLYWEEPEKNITSIFSHLRNLQDVDIVILPEMFSTGFSMKASHLAFDKHSPAIEKLQTWSDKTQTAICGSIWFKEGHEFTNRLVWISPNEAIQHYDKRHLFSLSAEPDMLKAGKERLIVEFKGWKIAPLICYDLRFPVWSKNNENYRYDLLIYVANWPEKRNYAWEQLLIARAIENQAYVAGINRVGKDGNGVNHLGASTIINPLGKQIIRAVNNVEQTIEASITKEELITYREKLPFLRDSDKFTLEA